MATSTKTQFKTVSLKPPAYKMLRRIATRKSWTMTTALQEAIVAFEASDTKAVDSIHK